jgi:hypothetical protein
MILGSECRDFSQIKLCWSIETGPELTGTVHEIGRIGKFPCPENVESCLESINPG